ncbi:HvfX family Cu-binding RiPP maturation protein [Neisseria sp. P0008.S010]|jgi:doxX family protein|uniref:DoxX family protein n=2 Tax=Neisseria elongata TaxID=495 RepID=D4DQC1_NEIEG|nr:MULTISPECIES: DoxX family protein [Neisseria]RKV69441.1 MAG: DoxX family protein [Neisseria sp.]AJE18779.1 membrane protein [Neisseria elongata subsp. glycolytica ATCC 29315]EFE50004.1 DoxX family protein [Neisseria elongata subsp. glycolytica ATCC 29315]MBM7064868.1 DoxX family protein [Neisseria elongata]MBS9341121.1 DoxX family protein [Neisseria elongata subsp. nitroreducens]
MDKTLGLCRSTEDCGKGISMLALRLFAAYEFGEAGLAKWRGENWFADIRDAFPFPFDLLPAGLSWNLAMGAELVVPVLLVLGLLTRLGALALMILTAVAWYAVHAGNGYNVCDNGYKMAFIYLLLLLPLLLQGAGKYSLDYLLFRKK